jgi:hypothetical protein
MSKIVPIMLSSPCGSRTGNRSAEVKVVQAMNCQGTKGDLLVEKANARRIVE